MPLNQNTSHGTQPPPSCSKTGHPLPRRTSPANSVTLRHHRLARDASLKASQGSGPAVKTTTTTSPRRNSSGDSNETGQSDPNTWFDQSNLNPTATFDSNVMEVDPPFFQKESDSSNEDKPYYNHHQLAPPKLTAAHSSSADDYRSVIDDLTVEIQKLREELKRYKNTGPDMLRKEKLFEIKCHGLPKKKKRELEATLRDFAAGLDGSPDTSSTQNKKKSRHANRDNMYSGSGSKHASSSSGSNFRPADSAYASMSTGAKSSGTSLSRPSMGSQAKSSEAVESYLRDIPEGLYPRHMIMTDKERRKLVVRRLEQLFTGKIGGRHVVKKQPVRPSGSSAALAPVVADTQPNATNASNSSIHEPPTLQTGGKEATREARILPTEQQSGHSGKKSRSADNGSASNSNGDNTESCGNGNSTGSGTNPSPPMTTLPEQRPTRPRDLDPDRAQVPAENMDYIRHLGLVPPELLAEQYSHDVHPDAEGWVYLNLLCNLAQLHMINVTPDFVRSAVTGMSTKFQLSPDGRKIRWRGGTEGTRFSSDSSGYNSQKSPSTDDTEDGSENKHKRQKTGRSTGDEFQSGSSSKNGLKYDPQLCAPSESFHYKPLFAQQESSGGQTSLDETVSSFGPPEESNVGESRWGLSGSGASSRKKRRHDGAIIYYSGAPFCTDLSGDPGDMSPTTQMRSGQTQTDKDNFKVPPSPLRRTDSGSFINYRPLTDRGVLSNQQSSAMEIDSEDPPSLTDDTDDASEIDLDFTWSNNAQYMQHYPLEPCGLGGVLPEDHFMVVVSTKRPKQDDLSSAAIGRTSGTTDAVVRRLETMTTSSPKLGVSKPIPVTGPLPVEIEYMSGRIKRLTPVSLPPPAIFFPPFSPSESTADDDDDDDDDVSDDLDMSQSLRDLMGQRTLQHQSDGYPDGVDLSSGDEEGDEPDDSPNQNIYAVTRDPKALPNRPRQAARRTSSAAAAADTARGASKSNSANPALSHNDNSSVATAGAAESGYSSSDESS